MSAGRKVLAAAICAGVVSAFAARAAAMRRAAWRLPPVARGVTALSVGLSLSGDGRLAVGALALGS